MGACKYFVEISCWHKRHVHVLTGMYSLLVTFCLTFSSFWLCLIVFASMICLNDVFLRTALTGVSLNTFPNALLIFSIYQCLLMVSLIFREVGLYCYTYVFLYCINIFNRVHLSKLPTFLIWFRMFSLYPFSTNHFTKLLECYGYSSKTHYYYSPNTQF